MPSTLGKVGGTWQSGFHLKSPLTDVTTFSTHPTDLNLTGDNTVEVHSSGGGVLYADLTVKWSIDPNHTLALYKLAGSSEAVQQSLVYPDSREIVRNVFARHTSVEGYSSQREAINAEISQLISDRLSPRGIIVNGVNLRNVRPNDSLQKAIDQKIQQDQATAQAQAAVLTAKAEAEKRKIDSESTAAANSVIANSLTDKILMSQCIDAFKAAAEKNPVYASPCGSTSTSVIVDGTKKQRDFEVEEASSGRRARVCGDSLRPLVGRPAGRPRPAHRPGHPWASEVPPKSQSQAAALPDYSLMTTNGPVPYSAPHPLLI